MSFEDLIQLPIFERKQSIRKKVFKGFWMTTKENFKIVKRIENENAKKELDKKKHTARSVKMNNNVPCNHERNQSCFGTA